MRSARCPSERTSLRARPRPGAELREQGRHEKQPPHATPSSARDMSKRPAQQVPQNKSAPPSPERLIAGQRHTRTPQNRGALGRSRPKARVPRNEFPEGGLATVQRQRFGNIHARSRRQCSGGALAAASLGAGPKLRSRVHCNEPACVVGAHRTGRLLKGASRG